VLSPPPEMQRTSQGSSVEKRLASALTAAARSFVSTVEERNPDGIRPSANRSSALIDSAFESLLTAPSGAGSWPLKAEQQSVKTCNSVSCSSRAMRGRSLTRASSPMLNSRAADARESMKRPEHTRNVATTLTRNQRVW